MSLEKRLKSSRFSRALGLVESGLANPTSVPTYLKNEFARRANEFKYEVHRRRRGVSRQKGRIHELLEEDEFVLIILDSCRYDAFEELYPEYLSGTLDRVWSSGNWTQKWMSRTWDGRYDLTYISTTPYTFDYAHEESDCQYRPSERFDEVIDVIGEEWNPVLSTTPPEPVTDIALQHIANADETRAVVHYMQPHAPYIGDTRILQWDIPDSEVNRLLEYVEGNIDELDTLLDDVTERERNGEGITVTELVRQDLEYRQEKRLTRENYETIDSQFKRGKISREELHEAYRDNLKYVLSEVRRLVSYLDCPVVVSADHGEHLGGHFDEIPKLTHPDRTHPVLREVPWFTVDDESKGRKELSDVELETGRALKGGDAVSEETITDRLEALGYR